MEGWSLSLKSLLCRHSHNMWTPSCNHRAYRNLVIGAMNHLSLCSLFLCIHRPSRSSSETTVSSNNSSNKQTAANTTREINGAHGHLLRESESSVPGRCCCGGGAFSVTVYMCPASVAWILTVECEVQHTIAIAGCDWVEDQHAT